MDKLIGISGSINYECDGIYPQNFINTAYTDSILTAGAAPIIIPICHNDDAIKKIVSSLDGILLSGGPDIHPTLFNEEPHKNIGSIVNARDILDFKIIKYAFEMKKPILGICRGLQVINVFFGGTLYQDIDSQTKSEVQHQQKSRGDLATHSVSIKANSFLHNIFGDKTLVNSFHHQSIKDMAKGFDEIATSINDNIVEAIEYKEDHFIVGLQWHPELLAEKNTQMQEIFNSFIKAIKS